MHTQQNTEISLRQYVLPYWNYATGKSGWQFGMPANNQDVGEDISVRVVQKNGRTCAVSSFEITRPHETEPGQPPRPSWFWVPVRCGGEKRFASVIPPREAPGSVPLSHLKHSNRERIFCKNEIEKTSRAFTKTDLSFSIPVNHKNRDELRAGNLILADVKIGGGMIQWIHPLKATYKLELWTSHLSRLAELQFTHGIEI